MTHDEDVYSDPFEFKPERFLEENGHIPEPDSRAVAFGFGRRYVLDLDAVLFLSLLTRFKNMPRKRARGKHGVYHCSNDSCCVQHPESEGRERQGDRTCSRVHSGVDQVQ